MPTIKPDSPAIQQYYRTLQEAEQQQSLNEGNVRALSALPFMDKRQPLRAGTNLHSARVV